MDRWTVAIALTIIFAIGVIAWVASRRRTNRRDAASDLSTSQPPETVQGLETSALVDADKDEAARTS